VLETLTDVSSRRGALVAEGANSRSGLRRVLDGAAIVLSILLAFAIDAGWDEVQERRAEQEILAGLQTDFTANQAQLSSVVAAHRRRAEVYSWFRGSSLEEIRDVSQDSANMIYTELWAPRTFDPARSSIDALIGAGRFGVIQDRELRNRLTGFLNLADDLAEESMRMQTGSEAVLQGTIPHGGPWQDELGPSAAFGDLPSIVPGDLATMWGDATLMGWISLAHQYSATYLEELGELGAAVEDVLARLGSQIR
jgi:hypothetical protein